MEKVRIPEGTEVTLTITDKENDGLQSGYFQLYSDEGSLILDEPGIFTTEFKRTFIVGEHMDQTRPPTVSPAPTASLAPSFNLYPITFEVQLDQWSDETSFSIQSIDGSSTFFNWPDGSSTAQGSYLVVETVLLPRDTEMNFWLTDTGGDGFCE